MDKRIYNKMKKTQVLKIIEIFGLFVDYDQWDEKGWIRIKHTDYPDFNNLVIYKDILEKKYSDNKRYPKENLYVELQNYLMEIGETKFKNKFHDLLN